MLAACGVAPLVVRAQAPRRVGLIHSGGSFERDNWAGRGFLKAMRDLGYEEGKDIVFDFRRWRRAEDVSRIVREFVDAKVGAIVVTTPQAISAAKSAADRVPVVFVFAAEPVATGLVPNLNRPGGNLTGLTWDHGFETGAKQVELLREALPALRRLAVLWDTAPDTTHHMYIEHYRKAGSGVGLQVISVGIRTPAEIEPAYEKIGQAAAEALIVLPSPQLTLPHREKIMEHARRLRLPTLAGIIHVTFPGALFQMAPNFADYPRRVAAYVDRILKGAKPGDLPVEQPNKYDLVVDLRAAKSLGITVPRSVLLRADKVLE